MKKIKVIAVIMFLVVLAGCNNESKEETEKPTPVWFDEIVTALKDQVAEDLVADGVEESEVMVDGQLAFYMETDLTASEESDPAVTIWVEKMDLDTDKLAKGKAIAPMVNINSDEIILLEAKDEADVASLKESFEKELAGQVQIWQKYLPEQYKKVEKNIIKTNGKYLLYVTYSDPKKIESVFDSHVK